MTLRIVLAALTVAAVSAGAILYACIVLGSKMEKRQQGYRPEKTEKGIHPPKTETGETGKTA